LVPLFLVLLINRELKSLTPFGILCSLIILKTPFLSRPVTSFYCEALNWVLPLFSVILPVNAPVSIIASVITVSATAVSNGYLRGRPLPRFGGSYGSASALGDS